MPDPTKPEFPPVFEDFDATKFVAAAAAYDKTPEAAGYRNRLATQFEAAGLKPSQIPSAEAIAETLITPPQTTEAPQN